MTTGELAERTKLDFRRPITAGEIGEWKAGVRTPKVETKFKPGEKLKRAPRFNPCPFIYLIF